MNQDKIFIDGEADRWFERNNSDISYHDWIIRDPVMKIIDLMNIVPQTVLEVGASNGYRLAELQKKFDCACFAIEPSQKAIEDGKSKNPKIKFCRGIASSMPYHDFQFDLVIVNFVFHWIDRSSLFQSIAEIDRIIKNGGFLIIGDFYPVQPEKVFYHHLQQENVWTYKQKYADIFISSNIYDMIAFITVDSANKNFSSHVDPKNRRYITVLKKNLNDLYKVKNFPTS